MNLNTHKILVYFLLLATCLTFSCKSRKHQNIKAFAKLYGYVRWFHPSDEAQLIDWDKFAIYGVKKVENAPSPKALRDTLLKLFKPVAPSLKIYLNNENRKLDISELIPKDISGYKVIAWQHYGVELNSTFFPEFQSIRTNRDNQRSGNLFPPVYYMYKNKDIYNKKLRLKLKIKGNKSDSLGLFILPIYNYNLQNLPKHIKPVYFKSNNQWVQQEVKTYLYNEDMILFGVVYNGDKYFSFDNFEIEMLEKNAWKKIEMNNLDLNQQTNDLPESFICFDDANYKIESFQISKKDKCLRIKKIKNYSLSNSYIKIGENIDKKISDELSIILPLALYGNVKQTYPASDNTKLKMLQTELKISQPKIYERIGALLITWNVFRHFYPYFDRTKLDWDKEFEMAIKHSFKEGTDMDFLKTLQKFTAKLNDGHLYISHTCDNLYCLPIAWELVENKLVITKVLDSKSELKAGDIVETINNKSSNEYLKVTQQYISAGSPGHLEYRSLKSSLMGEKNSESTLSIIDQNGKKRIVKLNHLMWSGEYTQKILNKPKYELLKNGIIYLNLYKINMAEIDSLMLLIKDSKGLICDLRGYPADNFKPFLRYLLKVPDTAKWMCIPQILYPEQVKMEFKKWKGWNLLPKNQHLNIPIVFISDSKAISYAESVLGIIKYYRLATIVGQPTAGANGNINAFVLPGQYQISFTGMKLTNLDGSQHHGIGILPDIYVHKTLQGVKEGRDEFLEKAIELINKK